MAELGKYTLPVCYCHTPVLPTFSVRYPLYQSSPPLALICWKQLANALEGVLVTSKRDNDLGPGSLQRELVRWPAVPEQKRICAPAPCAMCLREAGYVWVYLLISALLPAGMWSP